MIARLRPLLARLGLAPAADPDEVDQLVFAAWCLMRASHDDWHARGAAYQAVADIEAASGTRALLDRLGDEMRDAHARWDPRWTAARTGDLDGRIVVAHFVDRGGACADHVEPADLWLADYAAARTRGDYRRCTALIREAGPSLGEWTRRGLLVTARTVAALEQGVTR